MKKVYLFILVSIFYLHSFSQCTVQSIWKADYIYAWPFIVEYAMTPEIDVTGKPYVYVASSQLGVRIYKINGATPVLSATIDTSDIHYNVMSVSQYDTVLYVVFGNSFNTNDPPGVATYSVADPENPVFLDSWVYGAPGSGGGIVKVEGNYAYLGGMIEGLFILNISNPANIQYVSQFIPTIDYPFPNPSPFDYGKYNARGMEVKNGIVYLCYDGGGFRIINCTNPNFPIETGRYADPNTFPPIDNDNGPRAYNNIILNDTLVYIAVDYCGMEILNIKDTSNIQLVYHYNPVPCPDSAWVEAPVHANELFYSSTCKKLFMSTGKSKMIVLDVADPFNVDSCGGYGIINDTSATWGIDMRNDTIVLTYCVGFGVPFYAQHPGVELIHWTDACAVSVNEHEEDFSNLKIFPNPLSANSGNSLTIELDQVYQNLQLSIYNLAGQSVFESSSEWNYQFMINEKSLSPGIYQIVIHADGKTFSQSLVITP